LNARCVSEELKERRPEMRRSAFLPTASPIFAIANGRLTSDCSRRVGESCHSVMRSRTGAIGPLTGRWALKDQLLAAGTVSVAPSLPATSIRQDGAIIPGLGWRHGRGQRDSELASLSYVRGKFGSSATALSRPIACNSAADKPSSFMRRAVSFSGTKGLSLPNKI
jgi:hypothetical protein